MTLFRRFLVFIASVYTHKPTEDDPMTDLIDTTVVQPGADYDPAVLASTQASAAQPAVAGVDVQADQVLAQVFPGAALQSDEAGGQSDDKTEEQALVAKAKSIFAFLVREGHKAEDLFVEARDDIFALAAKLV